MTESENLPEPENLTESYKLTIPTRTKTYHDLIPPELEKPIRSKTLPLNIPLDRLRIDVEKVKQAQEERAARRNERRKNRAEKSKK